MVALNAARTSAQRRIALINPRFATDERAGHAVQLFDSVLWVFKGTTHTSWLTAAVDDAQVVVVHHSEPAVHLDAWRHAGKLIIQLSTDETSHPAGPRTLLYPFPAVQVLNMLERVEAEMDGGISDAPVVSATAKRSGPGTDPWSFVEALRTIRTLGNSTMWLECRGERGVSIWIEGDGSRYFCDNDTDAAIRTGSLELGGLTLQKGKPPPDNLRPRSRSELFWFAAYHASAAVAPWLEQKTSYRLLRWPDFGCLRPSDAALRTAQIRIVAALSDAPSSSAELAARTQTSIETATRTVNALVTCGFAEPVVATAPTQPSRRQNHAPVPAGGFKQFLRNLRQHLRLGATR
jgi:hypothetical protein